MCSNLKRIARTAPGRRAVHCAGFTLIEVMAVAVLMSTLAVMGAPSFAVWHHRDRVEAGTRAFVASLAYARSEAIRRADAVVVCRVVAAAMCAAGSKAYRQSDPVSWSGGWAVKVGAGHASSLRRQPRLNGVALEGAAAEVRFTPPAGQVVGGFRRFEVFADTATRSAHEPGSRRCITIAAGGRPRVTEGRCRRRA